MKERTNYNVPCQDHLGKTYANYREMAGAYGLTRLQLLNRIYAGMSLEEALTRPLSSTTAVKSCTDHLGKEYYSFRAMAKAYGLTSAMVLKRMNHYGWDLKKALTTPAEEEPNDRKIKCRDHLGNEYPSLTELSKAYGIPYVSLQRRLKEGWEMERALTTPVHKRPKKYVDHQGNEYSNQKELAAAYGMSTSTLHSRLKEGMDLEKALTMPIKGRWG